ncbi:MAG: FtsX-like permease family protein [Candidatus Fimenecus sp.]
MKFSFYPKLALSSIRKNKKLYLPYILTCIGMVAMYYIIVYLQYSDILSYMPKTFTLREMFNLGSWVIAIFALIFLFYTNSFLIRRRKKEFGLYNILGMGKKNICFLVLCETVITGIIALAGGLLAGVLFSKLAELVLVNIIKGNISYSLSVSPYAFLSTAAVFCAVFFLLFLNTVFQLRHSNAISLLRSENVGEKPPKGNWILALIGFVLLSAAYYLAITIKNPVSALTIFFGAVIMVIVGTYFLFISGSVTLCRALQKNKRYYYKPQHFVSVSSMAYRMKRNGAGLASICILATMVLVMLSSSASLYFGEESSLSATYPKEINVTASFLTPDDMSDENIAALRDSIKEINKKYNVTESNLIDFSSVNVAGVMENGNFQPDVNAYSNASFDVYERIYNLTIVSLSDYNRITGKREILNDNEILVYTDNKNFREQKLNLDGENILTVKEYVDCPYFKTQINDIVSSIVVFAPDPSATVAKLRVLSDYNGQSLLSSNWLYNFDTNTDGKNQIELRKELYEVLKQRLDNTPELKMISCESREENREDFYNTFGGLFFLGIILSIVFIFAAVLIIYYKQISEGYEDCARFDIMQKVGITKEGIRKSINSQLLTVFFMPLLFAGMHLAFAFPIISRLLKLFHLDNIMLFAASSITAFLVFALLYALVYKITSNAYYKIVSRAKK